MEVNYMDDVGQTLLNWASAFGTQEMVEFLCERGADVNKGTTLNFLFVCHFEARKLDVNLLLYRA